MTGRDGVGTTGEAAGAAADEAADSGSDAGASAGTTPRLRVRAVPRKGRGVFAAVAIASGDLLEAAPSVEIDDDIVPGSALDDFPFAHPSDPDRALIVFGLASLMNHADDPNTDETRRHVEGVGWILETRARRDIAPGEEITRRYACELWFQPDPPA